VWVADLEGRSSRFSLHGDVGSPKATVVSGFTGRVRYRCDGDARQARAVDALLAFARFAGVGSHTAYGLGTVRVRPDGGGVPARVRGREGARA
jgi:CRISPR/Cas system endoribonuclease Cas6 (RAMP superfamily)